MPMGPSPKPVPDDFAASYPVTPNAELGERYGVNPWMVMRWAKKLGLQKSAAYISEMRAAKRRHPVEEDGMKRCIACDTLKPIDNFYDASSKKTKMPRCKPCHGEATNAWRRSNPEAARRITRRSQLKNTYGISDTIWETLLELQGGKCAVCGRADDGSQAERRLHTDHCHETGVVRGLLCGSCNSGLGRFRHDIDLLRIAISYLENPPANGLLST